METRVPDAVILAAERSRRLRIKFCRRTLEGRAQKPVNYRDAVEAGNVVIMQRAETLPEESRDLLLAFNCNAAKVLPSSILVELNPTFSETRNE